MQSPDVSTYWQDIMGGFAKNEDPRAAAEPYYKSCTAQDDPTAVDRRSTRCPARSRRVHLTAFSIHSPKALEECKADKVTGER